MPSSSDVPLPDPDSLEAAAPQADGAAPSRAQDHLRAIGRGGTAMLFGQLANYGLRYIATVIVGRGLGRAMLGAFGLVMQLERFTQVLADAGLPQANQKFVADCLARDDRAGARATARLTGALSFVFTFALFAILWALSPAIADRFYHRPDLVLPLRIAALALPLASITGTLLSVQQAARNVLPLVLIARVGVPLLFLAGVAAAVYAQGSLIALVWSYVLAAAVGLLAALLVFARWLSAAGDGGERTVRLRQVLRFSITMCVAAIAGSVISMADLLVLKKFVSDEQLGVYYAAARTAFFVSFPLFAMNALYAPVISDLFALKDTAGLRHTYLTTTRWSTGAAFGLFGPMVIAPSLIMGIFGRGFHGGGVVLILLGAGQLVNSATGGVAWMLAMTGGQALLAWTNWVCAAISVGALVFACRWWGAVGAAACVGSVVAIANIARLIWVWRRLGFHPFDARYGICWLATGALIGVLSVLTHLGGAGASIGALAAYAILFPVIMWYGWLARENPLAARRRAGVPPDPTAAVDVDTT